MEPDNPWFDPVVLLVAAAVVVIVAPVVRRRHAARRSALDRFARRVALPVPEQHRDRVGRLLGARTLAADLGAAGGVTVVAAWALLTEPALVADTMWIPAVVGAAIAGVAIAAGSNAARHAARRPDGDGPRGARPSRPELGDAVAGFELWGGRIAALLPAGLLTVLVVGAFSSDVVPPADVVSVQALIVASLPVVGLAASEVVGRRLIERPQPAASDTDPDFSDALRARLLRDAVAVPIVVGTYATFALLLTLGREIDALGAALPGAPGGLAEGLQLGVIVVAAGMAVVALVSRPRTAARAAVVRERP